MVELEGDGQGRERRLAGAIWMAQSKRGKVGRSSWTGDSDGAAPLEVEGRQGFSWKREGVPTALCNGYNPWTANGAS